MSWTLPSAAIDNTRTRVLLAVLADRRPTVSTCVQRTGLARHTVHDHLVALRRAGLIDWIDGKRGTIHPLYRPVRR